MANTSVTGQQQLRDNLGQFMTYARSSLLDAAQSVAQDMERDMASSAPWTDQTGEARAGLSATAFSVGGANAGGGVGAENNKAQPGSYQQAFSGTGTVSHTTYSSGSNSGFNSGAIGGIANGIVIVAKGSSDHNVWLELAMGARYAIIRPKAQEYGPILMNAVRAKLASF